MNFISFFRLLPSPFFSDSNFLKTQFFRARHEDKCAGRGGGRGQEAQVHDSLDARRIPAAQSHG